MNTVSRFSFDKMERPMPETSESGGQLQLDTLKSCRPSSATCLRRGFSSLAVIMLLGAAACLPRAAAADSSTQQPLQPVLPSFSALVERVAPAVVSIRVKANPAAITTRDDDDEEEGDESSGK